MSVISSENSSSPPSHKSVLLEEICEALSWKNSDAILFDFTLGGGGHFSELLKRNPEPKAAYGFDRDLETLNRTKTQITSSGISKSNIHFIHARFDEWENHVKDIPTRIVMDLGVSSFQLDDGARGFSFRKEGPLDMRMDPSRGETASEFLKRAREEEIADAIYKYGEEKRSRVYARKIVHERKSKPLDTTKDLVEMLGFTLESRDRNGHHPLTRVFQGLRIAVNEELSCLETLLQTLPDRMPLQSRLAIITFHSLEDRLVKWTLKGRLHPINKKVILPTDEEQRSNPRARSAKLRIYEKV